MPALAFVGEAWGAEEERLRHPFVGPAGRELVRMCREAGIFAKTPYFTRPEDVRDFWLSQDVVSLHNVFNLRPANNDIAALCGTKHDDVRRDLPSLLPSKYLRAEFSGELDRLSCELRECRPNVVVALGNIPLWGLLRSGGISKVRGTVTTETLTGQGLKTLPTFHPAAILREWDNRAVTVLDLAKAKVQSAFPEVRRPARTIYLDPTLEDLEWFYANHIEGSSILSFDIETSGDQITCIGFASSTSIALVIPFVDPRREGRSYWGDTSAELDAWRFVRRVLGTPIPKLAQNGLYDIQFLWRVYGIPVNNFVHDTMLLHHALQPESKKGLGFLGSVYTDEASWKIMRAETIKRDE